MRRFFLLVAPAVLAMTWADGAAAPSDSSATDLQAELDALLLEIEGGHVPMLPPDRSPDLIIASTRQVLGEIAPCG